MENVHTDSFTRRNTKLKRNNILTYFSFLCQLINDWKSLRRAFKKLDVSRQGYLTVSQFRSVLKNANINLDEEEVYQLLSAFDENMTGRIPYNKFLSETFRPMTHQERLTGQADLLF